MLARRAVWRVRFRELDLWAMENIKADLSVEALAARVCMSATSFAHAYREVMGRTPAKFVEDLRLDEACRLIDEDEEMSLERVALAVGWSITRMRRAFGRRLGMSPNAWRELDTQTRPGATMTEEEQDAALAQLVETMDTFDKRLLCLGINMDRQFGNTLYYLREQLNRIEVLVGGTPPVLEVPPDVTDPAYEPPPETVP